MIIYHERANFIYAAKKNTLSTLRRDLMDSCQSNTKQSTSIKKCRNGQTAPALNF